MSKRKIMTRISQHEIKVLSEKDFDGYEKNKPGKNWEFVEYVGSKDEDGKPIRAWIPLHHYTLTTPEIKDHTKVVKIVLDGE